MLSGNLAAPACSSRNTQMPPLELASWQLSPSLPSPSLLELVLTMFILIHHNLIVFKIWMDGQVFLIQQVCACAHLRVNQLLNMWGISTTPLLISCYPL